VEECGWAYHIINLKSALGPIDGLPMTSGLPPKAERNPPSFSRLRQIGTTGKISLFPKGKSPVGILSSCPPGGALAIVTERWDGSCGGRGGIVRAMGLQGGFLIRERSQDVLTSGAEAYGKNVWARRLDAGVKSCGGAKAQPGRSAIFRGATETRQPATPG
jgi:hypothetical protein